MPPRMAWLLALAMIGISQAASFDCGRAVTKVEITICSSPQLSALDEQMGLYYSQRLSQTGGPGVKLEQRRWIKQTLQACEHATTVDDCVKTALLKRLSELAPGLDQRTIQPKALDDATASAFNAPLSMRLMQSKKYKVVPPLPIFKTSFDCQHAGNALEQTICSSSKLAELDLALGQKIAQAASDSNLDKSSKLALKQSQQAWLVTRNQCQDETCLSAAYRDRLYTFALEYHLASHQLVQPFAPQPAMNGRGQLDVWKLRDDLQAMRVLVGAMQDQDLKQGTLDRFNAAWLPAIRHAAEHGDEVAEVILLNCSVVPQLLRTGLPSTCEIATAGREQASQRLKKIGFTPALDWEAELHYWMAFQQSGEIPKLSEDETQAVVGKAYEAGNFGLGVFSQLDVHGLLNHGSVRQNALYEALSQMAPDVFAFAPWASSLAIDRVPYAPKELTFGPARYIDGKLNTNYGYVNFWRTAPRGDTICKKQGPGWVGDCTDYIFGDPSDRNRAHTVIPFPEVMDEKFPADLTALLQRYASNVKQSIQQDERWRIFLMHRIGHHEFVPDGMESSTGKLKENWVGNWRLAKQYLDWKADANSPSGSAEISLHDGEYKMTVRTSIASKGGPPDVNNCALRYSGGATPVQGAILGNRVQIGPMQAYDPNQPINRILYGDAFSPLAPNIAYRQVLMLCKGGESVDTDNVRFLFLTGDTLIELFSESPSAGHPNFSYPIFVRHYQRAGVSPSP